MPGCRKKPHDAEDLSGEEESEPKEMIRTAKSEYSPDHSYPKSYEREEPEPVSLGDTCHSELHGGPREYVR